ncbi:MAG: DUF4391 domain-containing protein [Desulfovibrionaceae bacterium]|nr:DUF4391 domain-containing protein [Desulfovibrionaceae bacterium]
MLNLPDTTILKKRIPRQQLYEEMSSTPALKKAFKEQVLDIWWINKLAEATTKIATGINVSEIQVFEVHLAGNTVAMEILRQIDRCIPYHILFLLEHDGRYQAVMAYKEIGEHGTILTLDRYFRTDWMNKEDLPLRMEGDSLDEVYETFIRQIAGDTLCRNENASLKDCVAEQKQNDMLHKQIAALESKIQTERQPKKKFWLVQELRKLQETGKH